MRVLKFAYRTNSQSCVTASGVGGSGSVALCLLPGNCACVCGCVCGHRNLFPFNVCARPRLIDCRFLFACPNNRRLAEFNQRLNLTENSASSFTYLRVFGNRIKFALVQARTLDINFKRKYASRGTDAL